MCDSLWNVPVFAIHLIFTAAQKKWKQLSVPVLSGPTRKLTWSGTYSCSLVEESFGLQILVTPNLNSFYNTGVKYSKSFMQALAAPVSPQSSPNCTTGAMWCPSWVTRKCKEDRVQSQLRMLTDLLACRYVLSQFYFKRIDFSKV